MAYRLTLKNPNFMWTKTRSRSIVVRTKDEYDDLFKDEHVALIKGYINYDSVMLSVYGFDSFMIDYIDVDKFYINKSTNLSNNALHKNGGVDCSIDGVKLRAPAKVELTNPKLALDHGCGNNVYDDFFTKTKEFILKNHLYTEPKEAIVYSKLVGGEQFDIAGPYWEDLDNPNEYMFIDALLPHAESGIRREVYEAVSCRNEFYQLLQKFNEHFDEQIQFYKEYDKALSADIPSQFKIQSKVDVKDKGYTQLRSAIHNYLAQDPNSTPTQQIEALKTIDDPKAFIYKIIDGDLSVSFEFEAFDHLTEHVFVRTFFEVTLNDIAKATNYDATKFMKIVINLLNASKNEISVNDFADFTVQADFSQQVNASFDLYQALDGINKIRDSTIENVISWYEDVIKNEAVLTWYFTAGEPGIENDSEEAYYSEIIIEKVTD